jgi:hypothetical protein
MRDRGAIWLVAVVMLTFAAAAAAAACGGGSKSSGASAAGTKGHTIEARVRSQAPIIVVDGATECRFDGTRQYTAK